MSINFKEKLNQNIEAVKKVNEKVIQTNSFQNLSKKEIELFFNQYNEKIVKFLPEGFSQEKLMSQVINLLDKNNDLKKCTPKSIVSGVIASASLGLTLESPFEMAYLVPYYIKEQGYVAQFQISWKGYKSLAKRFDEILDVYANCVYEGDDFDYELGLYSNKKLVHKPYIAKTRQELNERKLLYVYAGIKYKDGRDNFIVLDYNEIESLRRRNPMQKEEPSGAWKTNYDDMAKAKAIKKLKNEFPVNDYSLKFFKRDEQVISDFEDINERVVYTEEELKDKNITTISTPDNSKTILVNVETGEVINEQQKNDNNTNTNTNEKTANHQTTKNKQVQVNTNNKQTNNTNNSPTSDNDLDNLFNK